MDVHTGPGMERLEGNVQNGAENEGISANPLKQVRVTTKNKIKRESCYVDEELRYESTKAWFIQHLKSKAKEVSAENIYAIAHLCDLHCYFQ